MDAVAATPSASGAASGVAAARDQTAAAGRAIAGDFQTFLRLLTTQLQNQDPLKPLESTEFVAQLAQFSGVEQQIATNTMLGRILDAIGTSGAGALGDWLGREVRAAAPLDHPGGPVRAWLDPAPSGALSGTLVVRRADGGIAAEVPFPVGETQVSWDGRLTDGKEAPAGVYRFEARWAMPEAAVETRDAQIYARVIEARREGGEVVLGLAGGGSVPAAQVAALREARPTGPAG